MASNIIASKKTMKRTRTVITEDMKIEQELFNYISSQKEEDWESVVRVHETYGRRAFETKIIGTGGDTALNLAISDERLENVVERLVGLLRNNYGDNREALEILKLKNDKKRTPLHAAAATGKKEICRLIAGFDKSLVLDRDYTGETPLFRAVRYGRIEAFLYFHSLVFDEKKPPEERDYCWDNKDQTILHIAIARENFDLAYQIINLYPELLDLVDKDGDTPLHSLARKPAAFKSGSTFRGRIYIIYKCVSVKPLEIREVENSNPIKDETNPKSSLNKNNKRSSDLLSFINGLLFSRNSNIHGQAKKEHTDLDLESGQDQHFDKKGSNNAADQESTTTTNYKPNNIIYKYAKLVCGAVVPYMLGYGYMSVRKIQEQKQKHVWSEQVLDALLLENAALCQVKKALLRASDLQKTKAKTIQGNVSDQNVNNEDDEKLVGDHQNISERSINVSKSADAAETSKNKEYKTESAILLAASGVVEIVEKIIARFPTAIYDKETTKNKETKKEHKTESAILLAASYGVVEIVEKIIARFPTAIYDKGEESKNVVLVALKKRHLEMYKLLLRRYKRDHIVFQKVDDNGNTALHYAAMYDPKTARPWPVPGAALQMQWEIKWLEYVENTMPASIFSRTNKNGETPKELFSDNHKCLVKEGGDWLMSTATSCSVVATLIATVAFASSTTAPGGTDKESGRPNLERNPTFELFAILSLVALCFSVTSLLMFLAILTSRHQEKDFGKALPRKILFGLTSLFVAIASMLVTFCAGHFLVFEDKIKYAVLPIYAVTLLPLCFFAAAQFPLYFDLLLATFGTPF